jgi:ferredoxin
MGRSKKSFDRLLKGYKYKDFVFKLTKVPVARAIGRRLIDADSITLTYIPVCEDLEVPPGTVAPVSIIEHFINEASHHLILSRCPCRSENRCKDFDPFFGCTFLGPAVLEVDPEVGRLVTREEALGHLRQATEAGLVSCVGKFKGDAIAMGIKDHHRLMTICHCCPCCCITTSMPYAAREARDLLVKLEGVRVEVTDECNGCGRCVETCMVKQIDVVDGKAVIGEECKGCGRCAMVCKRDAVRVIVDNPAYVDECVERISSRVEIA